MCADSIVLGTYVGDSVKYLSLLFIIITIFTGLFETHLVHPVRRVDVCNTSTDVLLRVFPVESPLSQKTRVCVEVCVCCVTDRKAVFGQLMLKGLLIITTTSLRGKYGRDGSVGGVGREISATPKCVSRLMWQRARTRCTGGIGFNFQSLFFSHFSFRHATWRRPVSHISCKFHAVEYYYNIGI